ncbi:MAG: NAD(P)-binding protein [Roseburia sp.]|nr:NAD(P)-binding protein [Roseburia sp.]
MIQIQQLKLPITHNSQDLKEKVCKTLKISPGQLNSMEIVRQSIDARKKAEISYVYTILAKVAREETIYKKIHNPKVSLTQKKEYRFPMPGTEELSEPPVIVGSGPAGLFCGYMLAKAGYRPVILERGARAEERREDVALFWEQGRLNPLSNVSFGEGGAGTFSDGKLNTLVKDDSGRNRKVLEIFMEHGAPKEIGYEAKPHIGTDQLTQVIPAIRRDIENFGGTVLFHACMTDMRIRDGKVTGICLNNDRWLDTQVVVLAIGHSARDTFGMLLERQIPMEPKAFAVGLRVEHPQEMINVGQYGKEAAKILSPASYKVTANLENGRGVYSFCMCPGGYVVNASSQENALAVNGMSYSKRDGKNANSAIIVSLTPKDFGGEGALSGVEFQQRLEKKAFSLGEGRIPQQLYGDFKEKRPSHSYGSFSSGTKGESAFAPLHQLFSEEIYQSFLAGMERFSGKIPDFNREDAILSGVESRTSSPVRILRGNQLQSSIAGLYPCGEGAGYAGGIMSAAMDGIKVAEAVAGRYAPMEKDEKWIRIQ